MAATVEEVRKLWCPMARTVRVGDAPYDGSYNRVVSTSLVGIHVTAKPAEGELPLDEPMPVSALRSGVDYTPVSARCIADQCAMWRWATVYDTPAYAEPGTMVPKVKTISKTHGFCGLAGRPEVQP